MSNKGNILVSVILIGLIIISSSKMIAEKNQDQTKKSNDINHIEMDFSYMLDDISSDINDINIESDPNRKNSDSINSIKIDNRDIKSIVNVEKKTLDKKVKLDNKNSSIKLFAKNSNIKLDKNLENKIINVYKAKQENEFENSVKFDIAKDLGINSSEEENEFLNSSFIQIVVDGNDTLWSLSRKYGTTVNELVKINSLKSTSLRPNSVLKVKVSKNKVIYKVKKNESLWTIAKKYKVSVKNIIQDNKLNTTALRIGQMLIVDVVGSNKYIKRHLDSNKIIGKGPFIWPVTTGYVTSGFGRRLHPITKRIHFHTAIDVAAKKDSPIYASASGTVVYSAYRSRAGRTVIVNHKDGYKTMYSHCNKLLVKKGQYVKKGQLIATIGRTGRATGYHVHFAVKKGKNFIDPLVVLKDRK